MTVADRINNEIIPTRGIITQYNVRGHTISIKYDGERFIYLTNPNFQFELNPLIFAELSSIVFKNKERLSEKILKFDELVDTIKSLCMWKVLEIKKLKLDPELFLELFIYRLIKLQHIMPLFLDDNVDEIYMDKKNTPLYLDHQKYGRCDTTLILEEEEINSLITRLKLEHPIHISTKNPSLKVEFQSKFFHLRVSMDFPPLSPNGPTFNIRKLRTKPLKLIDLIELGTMPSIVGAYLIEAVKQRKNITIIGEPNAGKTTLANAIDLYTPKHWRKVAIEDAIESINQTNLGFKQLSIQVNSFESNLTTYTKTSEILKLLHRSPDWIYLGEIQSKEHTQSMFEALNAGLKGIQTAHSDSIEKILRRWENLHGISPTDFFSLDIIVVMQREITENSFIRRISKIYEIDKKATDKISGYNFIKKIYSKTEDIANFFKKVKENSILRNYFDSIIETKVQLETRV
ncbi:MAG: ATPase, T2SS/T4P/T4SS family [Candidatus Heimdallarchaeaceae archaeon]